MLLLKSNSLIVQIFQFLKGWDEPKLGPQMRSPLGISDILDSPDSYHNWWDESIGDNYVRNRRDFANIRYNYIPWQFWLDKEINDALQTSKCRHIFSFYLYTHSWKKANIFFCNDMISIRMAMYTKRQLLHSSLHHIAQLLKWHVVVFNIQMTWS